MPTLAFIPTAPPPDEQENVWRADRLDQVPSEVLGTGFAALDAVLPGGGWPVGALTELLHVGADTHAWPLLLPAVVQAVVQRRSPVLLVGPPQMPFGPSLAAHGLPPEALLWVRCDAPTARLWACEQALRCADVAAVLAWLPQARVAELRRLQVVAAQHEALLWAFRPAAVAGVSSPARLRLQVGGLPDDAGLLEVQVLKRRGPPLAQALYLPAQPPRLSALIAAARQRAAAGLPAAAKGTASGTADGATGGVVLPASPAVPMSPAVASRTLTARLTAVAPGRTAGGLQAPADAARAHDVPPQRLARAGKRHALARAAVAP